MRCFTLPLLPTEATQSRRRWLDVMAQIPFGTTISYAALAAATSHSKAECAASTACATSPILITYPYHKVLCSGEQLGKYDGGSDLPPTHQDNSQRKALLISHETQQLNQQSLEKA